MSRELAVEVLKTSPGWGVAGMHVFGVSLPDLVSLATLTYVVILIAYKLWSWSKEWRKGRHGNEQERGD
ncbi:holin [Pantoea phage Nifs112]|nr:holin [Pantoea phage Nifs112]